MDTKYPPFFSNAKNTYGFATVQASLVRWCGVSFWIEKRAFLQLNHAWFFHMAVEVVAVLLLPLLFLMYYCPIAAVADVCSKGSTTEHRRNYSIQSQLLDSNIITLLLFIPLEHPLKLRTHHIFNSI